MTKPPLPVLVALGQPTRWRVFETLLPHGSEGMLQGEIAKVLGIEKNLLSVHLRVMREAGLVEAERRGREVTYRVKPEAARRAADTMIRAIENAASTDGTA